MDDGAVPGHPIEQQIDRAAIEADATVGSKLDRATFMNSELGAADFSETKLLAVTEQQKDGQWVESWQVAYSRE